MKERDVKFATKAGMATALLAAPAFFDATRPFFLQNWGEWALISVTLLQQPILCTNQVCLPQFFVVISPTIGAVSAP